MFYLMNVTYEENSYIYIIYIRLREFCIFSRQAPDTDWQRSRILLTTRPLTVMWPKYTANTNKKYKIQVPLTQSPSDIWREKWQRNTIFHLRRRWTMSKEENLAEKDGRGIYMETEEHIGYERHLVWEEEREWKKNCLGHIGPRLTRKRRKLIGERCVTDTKIIVNIQYNTSKVRVHLL